MQAVVERELWEKFVAPDKQSFVVPAGQQPFELIYLFQNSGGNPASFGKREYAVVRSRFKCLP